MTDVACSLCTPPEAEATLWQDTRCRVIDVAAPDYPGYCRVVWNRHTGEMSDLTGAERAHLMRVVYAAEQALRALLRPDKINLASLGNQVPHLHWHVIPRFIDDPHFPDPIWAVRRREGRARRFDADALSRELARRMAHRRNGNPQET